MKAIFIVLAVATAVIAAPTDQKYNYPVTTTTESYAIPPEYSFSYGVNHGPTNIDLGHSEIRKKDDTKGKYYVNLPDGRQQVVKYAVDGNLGYVATVEYHGESNTPSYESTSSSEYDLKSWPKYKSTTITKQKAELLKYSPEYQAPKQIKTEVTTAKSSEKFVYVKDLAEPAPATTQKPETSTHEETVEVQTHHEVKGMRSATLFREELVTMESKNEDKRW